jgi:TPR repeat protein
MVTAGKWSWPEDAEGALKYLTMAAELNNAEAMTALGNFYACRGDSTKAIRWFTEARDSGDSVARYSLKEMRDWGIDEWECRFL